MSFLQDNCSLCARVDRQSPKQPGYVYEHEAWERRRQTKAYETMAASMFMATLIAIPLQMAGLPVAAFAIVAGLMAIGGTLMLLQRARWQKIYPSTAGYLVCELETGRWHMHLQPPGHDSTGQPGFTIYRQFHPVHQFGLSFPRLGDNEVGKLVDFHRLADLTATPQFHWELRILRGGGLTITNGQETFRLSQASLLAALRFMRVHHSLFAFVEHVLRHETPDAPRGRAVELEAAVTWLAERVREAAPLPLHGRTMANVLEVITQNNGQHFDHCLEAEHARGVEMIAKLNAAVNNGGLGVPEQG